MVGQCDAGGIFDLLGIKIQRKAGKPFYNRLMNSNISTADATSSQYIFWINSSTTVQTVLSTDPYSHKVLKKIE